MALTALLAIDRGSAPRPGRRPEPDRRPGAAALLCGNRVQAPERRGSESGSGSAAGSGGDDAAGPSPGASPGGGQSSVPSWQPAGYGRPFPGGKGARAGRVLVRTTSVFRRCEESLE